VRCAKKNRAQQRSSDNAQWMKKGIGVIWLGAWIRDKVCGLTAISNGRLSPPTMLHPPTISLADDMTGDNHRKSPGTRKAAVRCVAFLVGTEIVMPQQTWRQRNQGSHCHRPSGSNGLDDSEQVK
jgi:hypothetical protein